jgi:hypothetical protein
MSLSSKLLLGIECCVVSLLLVVLTLRVPSIHLLDGIESIGTIICETSRSTKSWGGGIFSNLHGRN